MTATNHVLTGAVIAVAVKRPELAIPLAFASHFVLDAIPHFGFEEGDVMARNSSRRFKVVIWADAAAVVIAIIGLPVLARQLGASVGSGVLVMSMLAAFSPDIVWIYRFFKERRAGDWLPAGRFSRFHKKIQRSETERGIHVEYLWGAGMVLLLGLVL